ncbi:MAG: helicase-exonuclease AddAB subunit AddB [Desulfotomaculaceae bacterium]|nr:helicase-exonuclease AddAB subunit AddB [Desulfotomaculaceae bacterium]
MSLRFIIGRAGSGKTRTCLEEIRAELKARPAGTPLVLLVPEQATFQTEYALAATPGLQGFIRAQVLSFRRLAYRVLQEAGGAARPHIGELGKRMLLRRLLEQRREEIRVFRRSAGQPGFADTLARTLGEIKSYCIEPADLTAAAAALRDLQGAETLAEKLEDLYLLYNDLEDFLEDRFIDPDDYLNLLADRLALSRAVHDGQVWVDGFSGFTPQEYRVLASLLGHAGRVTIALCVDLKTLGGKPDHTGMFYPIQETYESLCQLAARAGVLVERPLVLDGSEQIRYLSPEIAHLEKHFFSYPAPKWNDAGGSVTLAAAANPRAETEGVAREITALCRDAGYRYRDIIILLRDLDHYAGLISSVFADHGIPVFIDQKRPVMHHPLVELVRAALEVIISDWSFDPVFRFLKTDLTPLAREEVDLLENYVLAHGIRGSRWTDDRPWAYRRRLSLEEDREITELEAGELEAINRIRRQAVVSLSEFCRAAGQAAGVRAVTAALFHLLEELEVPELLESWSKAAESEGLLELAREHGQIWDGLTALLDQMVEALGDEVLSIEEYAAILDAGLASMRLGLIPPGFDQVVVCSLERSRSPEARAAFVMGASDGVLPARVTDKGILSEGERERLQAVGLRLAPGACRRAFDEQYLIYIALTRSSEKLYLSYPLADDEGGALAPSPVAARIKELLPELAESSWPVEPNGAAEEELAFVSNPGRTLSHLVTRMREVKAGRPVDPLWQDVYAWFMASEYKEKTAYVLSSLFKSNREGRLPAGAGRALYGRRLKTSVSGIEKFRACPFAHFLARGLNLQERTIYKIGAPDLGQFFHAALKNFGNRVGELGIGWGQLDQEQCRALAGDVVDELAPQLQNEILISTARRRYLTGKLKKTVQQTALVLAEHARRGSFQPVGLELAFGPQGDLPAVTFVLPGGNEMILAGRIDRIDAVQGDEGLYLRIIDYKSGRAAIKLQDIYHGLKLQLLAYLDVALRYAEKLAGGQALPGAILYFRIADPLVRTDGVMPAAEDLERKILREFRMTGLVLADPEVVQLMDSGLTGDSDLIPVQIKKDGEFASRSAVLTPAQFTLLREHLRRQLISAGTEIMDGVVAISPYRSGSSRSCQYCPYKPVCQFDILMEGNTYRNIKAEADGAIWSKLQRMRGDTVE